MTMCRPEDVEASTENMLTYERLRGRILHKALAEGRSLKELEEEAFRRRFDEDGRRVFRYEGGVYDLRSALLAVWTGEARQRRRLPARSLAWNLEREPGWVFCRWSDAGMGSSLGALLVAAGSDGREVVLHGIDLLAKAMRRGDTLVEAVRLSAEELESARIRTRKDR